MVASYITRHGVMRFLGEYQANGEAGSCLKNGTEFVRTKQLLDPESFWCLMRVEESHELPDRFSDTLLVGGR